MYLSKYLALFVGELVGYLNISSLLPHDGTVEDASHTEDNVVRAVAVAQKFKVIAFVLYDGHNETQLNFTVKVKDDESHTSQVTNPFLHSNSKYAELHFQ